MSRPRLRLRTSMAKINVKPSVVELDRTLAAAPTTIPN